jgi:pyrroloquinoline quinone (PQQ) biosynthesis protein C
MSNRTRHQVNLKKGKTMKDNEFVRTGPLMEIASYPEWAQEMLQSAEGAKQKVVTHELFGMIEEAYMPPAVLYQFFVGGWPVIEQFPQYMAVNLCKVKYGRSEAENMARKYLMKNIRVEQNHADHWVDWAEASGVTREQLLHADVPVESQALNHWCWHSCERDSLATSMAATNLAIEGATGEWSTRICASDTYENSFDPAVRKKGMRWLKMHAHYDDTHPWEALDIVCSLIGQQAESKYVSLLSRCISNSYEYMALSLDRCLLALPEDQMAMA